jgi:hypothetical protein
VIKNPQLATEQHRSTSHHRTWEEEEEGKEILHPKPQKTNNSIQDLVGNKENEHTVPDPNRTMPNITIELSNTHKKISQGGTYR